MFQSPRYIRNSFSISFPRQIKIRRRANDFEDYLGAANRLDDRYFHPQVLPIPDDFDPEIPRIIFGSEHGFSQIVFSQISLSLNVTYSPDWQDDINKGKEYLNRRVPILFDLIDILKITEVISFCGLVTQVRLSTPGDNDSALSHVTRIFLQEHIGIDLYDIELKMTTTQADKYFSNLTLRNYRIWEIPDDEFITRPPLRDNRVVGRGVEVIGDYNDRYAYNQKPDYHSGRNSAEKIIEGGIEEVGRLITRIRE